jgi:hypothetical protein
VRGNRRGIGRGGEGKEEGEQKDLFLQRFMKRSEVIGGRVREADNEKGEDWRRDEKEGREGGERRSGSGMLDDSERQWEGRGRKELGRQWKGEGKGGGKELFRSFLTRSRECDRVMVEGEREGKTKGNGRVKRKENRSRR